MAKYAMMVACACEMKACHRTLHLLGNPGRAKVRLVVKDGADLVGAVVLSRENVRTIGLWLLDKDESVGIRPKRYNTGNLHLKVPKAKRKKEELMPWQIDEC